MQQTPRLAAQGQAVELHIVEFCSTSFANALVVPSTLMRLQNIVHDLWIVVPEQ